MYHSRALWSHHLLPTDTLAFNATDSLYITRVGDIAAWQDGIVISDFYTKAVHVFDMSLRYKTTLGRRGGGPGEFMSFPVLVPAGEFLWLLDEGLMRATVFGPDRKVHAIKPLPQNYYFRRQAVCLGDKFVVTLNPQRVFEKAADLKGESPLAILDTNLNMLRRLWAWDDVYFSDDLAISTFAYQNADVLLALAWDGGFFALQQASHVVTQFGKDLVVKKRFGVRPVFFKYPPDEPVPYSTEGISEYLGKTTTFVSIDCDTERRFVFVDYVNFDRSILFARTLLAGQHYLQVYDGNYDCIFDGPIPGVLALVKSGRVYVLTHEQPEFIRMVVFAIVK